MGHVRNKIYFDDNPKTVRVNGMVMVTVRWGGGRKKKVRKLGGAES